MTLTTLNEKIRSILPEFPGFQVDGDRLTCETNCGPITIDLYDWIGADGDEKKILKLACEKIAWKLKQQEGMSRHDPRRGRTVPLSLRI